jgi:hypothetical protein
MPSSLVSLALLLSPAFDPPSEVVGLTGAAVELEVAAGAATALKAALALSDAFGIG